MEITSWEQLQALGVGTEIRIFVADVYWGFASIKWKQNDVIAVGCEIVDGSRLVIHLFDDCFSSKTKRTYVKELVTVQHIHPKIYA